MNMRNSYCTFSMDYAVLRLLRESSNGCKVVHSFEFYEGKKQGSLWENVSGNIMK